MKILVVRYRDYASTFSCAGCRYPTWAVNRDLRLPADRIPEDTCSSFQEAIDLGWKFTTYSRYSQDEEIVALCPQCSSQEDISSTDESIRYLTEEEILRQFNLLPNDGVRVIRDWVPSRTSYRNQFLQEYPVEKIPRYVNARSRIVAHRLPEDKFCGDCEYLNISEIGQGLRYESLSRQFLNHYCTFDLRNKVRLFHGDDHPEIRRCQKCLRRRWKENREWIQGEDIITLGPATIRV